MMIPNTYASSYPTKTPTSPNPQALLAQLVLVHGDDLTVQQDLLELRLDLRQVHAHHQGSSQDRPHRHLHLGLVYCQPRVTYYQLERKQAKLVALLKVSFILVYIVRAHANNFRFIRHRRRELELCCWT